MPMRIDRSTAKQMYEQGHPVSYLDGAPWFSVAAPTWGIKTFDELEARARQSGRPYSWHKPSPSRQTMDEALGHIFRRESFRIGSVSAASGNDAGWATGDLPAEWRALVIHSQYVVRSYETPIAWIDPDSGDVVMPPVRYSNTTTQHQDAVARALGLDGFSPTDGSVRKGKGHTPYTHREGY